MGESLRKSFSLSIDGRIRTASRITAPSDDYISRAPHALVKGVLFIFGGGSDLKKVIITFADFMIETLRL